MAAGQSNYCAISREHTMCKFTGTGNKCIDLSARGVDESSKQSILQIHNSLRSKVAGGLESGGVGGGQPGAANMQLLTWDEELAAVAQRWADQCAFQHDCSDCRRVDRFFVGQNLYTEGSTVANRQPNWNAAVTAWYDEVNEFSSTNVDRFQFSAATGHYTQVVWATTNKIGCGFTTYRNGAFISSLYVCNYGPAGNTIFAEMYKRGPACSRCPSGTSCSSQFPGLCASSGSGGDDISNLIPMTQPDIGKPVSPPAALPSPAQKPTVTSTPAPASPGPFRPNPVTPGSGFSPFRPSIGSGSSRTNSSAPGGSFGPFRPGFNPNSGTGFTRPNTVNTNSGSKPNSSGKNPGSSSNDYFVCSLGKNPCRGSFAGSPWKFKSAGTKNPRIKRQSAEFIESSVAVGNSTEFRLDNSLPAPQEDKLCLSVSLMRDVVNVESSSSGRLTVPPLAITVHPQESRSAVIRLDNLTPSSSNGWLEARVTLRGVKTPFRLAFQQEGPQADNGIPGLDVPAVQVSLNKLKLRNGACN